MNRKFLLIGIISIVLIALGLIFYRKYQVAKFKSYKPTPETCTSISKFLETHNTIQKSTLIVPINNESYNILQPPFGLGSIYVLDKDLKIIDNNITDENGRCYSDINKYICGDFVDRNKSFSEKYKNRIQLLRKNTKYLFSNKTVDFNNGSDYYIIYSWAKYMPPSYDPKQLEFLECIKNKKITCISLNLDDINF